MRRPKIKLLQQYPDRVYIRRKRGIPVMRVVETPPEFVRLPPPPPPPRPIGTVEDYAAYPGPPLGPTPPRRRRRRR